MQITDKDMLLYAVTDRTWLHGRRLVDVVRESLEGGVTFVQLREKNLDRAACLEEAKELKALCAEYHVPFVIDDDVELALMVDADGVHVGQSDMEAGDVRAKLGPDKIIGVTAKTVAQALAAEAAGASYLGVGAAFPTTSKADTWVISHDTYHEITSRVKIPVVAIGGITSDNLGELQGTGISGVAVISAIYAQPDIKAAAKKLLEKIRKTVEA